MASVCSINNSYPSQLEILGRPIQLEMKQLLIALLTEHYPRFLSGLSVKPRLSGNFFVGEEYPCSLRLSARSVMSFRTASFIRFLARLFIKRIIP